MMKIFSRSTFFLSTLSGTTLSFAHLWICETLSEKILIFINIHNAIKAIHYQKIKK